MKRQIDIFKTKTRVIWSTIIIISLIAVLTATLLHKSLKKQEVSKEIKEILQVEIKSNKKIYRIGEPIYIEFKIMAKSSFQTIYAGLTLNQILIFKVIGPDGKVIEYSGIVCRTVRQKTDFIWLHRNGFYGAVLNLLEYYRLTEPGKYSITATYKNPYSGEKFNLTDFLGKPRRAWVGELQSNTIIITLKKANRSSISSLIRNLESDDPLVRKESMIGLGQIGNEQAIQTLVKALGDEDGLVQFWAEKELREIGEPAIPALIKALDTPDVDVRRWAVLALSEIGSQKKTIPALKSAIPALIKALDTPDIHVRRQAVVALSRIGSQKAIPALRKMLDDEDEHVRRRAQGAIERIEAESK